MDIITFIFLYYWHEYQSYGMDIDSDIFKIQSNYIFSHFILFILHIVDCSI